MQEEFENLCFIPVLMKNRIMVVCLRDAEMVVCDQSFFMDLVFGCGEAR